MIAAAAVDWVVEQWRDLEPWTRVAIALGGALALAAVAGHLLRRRPSGGVLWGSLVFAIASTAALIAVSYGLPRMEDDAQETWSSGLRFASVATGMLAVQVAAVLAVPFVLDVQERSGFSSLLAARHFRVGRRGFLNAISLLSIGGVAVSSFAMCGVLSVLGGFSEDLKQKILGSSAHITIESEDVNGIAEWRASLELSRGTPGVVAATPLVTGEVMASSASNTAGLVLRGVELGSVGSVLDLPRTIREGELRFLDDPAALHDQTVPTARGNRKTPADSPVLPGIVIGREVARSLHVDVGSEIRLVSPMGDLGPMGVLPRTRSFRVAGVFYSGMYEYDASFGYVRLADAQRFLDLDDRVSSIAVRVGDEADAPTVAEALDPRLASGLHTRDWQRANQQLFSALALEKVVAFVILALAVLVAAFCIICTLLLLVTEKRKQIAVLMALGATRENAVAIFLKQGVIIGAVGTTLGIAAALTVLVGLQTFGVGLDPDVYYIERLPISVNPWEILSVALTAMAITTIAAYFPARNAAGVRPVDGIRYE